MTQEEINDYNRRCALFLGWSYNKDFDEYEPTDYRFGSAKWLSDMQFHSDWNWIIEICISIGMEFVTTNKQQLIQQIYDKLRSMETNS